MAMERERQQNLDSLDDVQGLILPQAFIAVYKPWFTGSAYGAAKLQEAMQIRMTTLSRGLVTRGAGSVLMYANVSMRMCGCVS